MKDSKVSRSRRVNIPQLQSAEGLNNLSQADALELCESLYQLSCILFQLFQEQQKSNNENRTEQDSGNPKEEIR